MNDKKTERPLEDPLDDCGKRAWHEPAARSLSEARLGRQARSGRPGAVGTLCLSGMSKSSHEATRSTNKNGAMQ